MANTINLAEKYIPLLDEKYKQESKTEILDAPTELIRESMNAKTIFIPRIEIDGLGDYDRNTGFNDGSVDVNWESHEFTQDRGTQFMIDAADDMETVNIAFGRAAGEFIRTQVAPELDAYRFAEMADAAVAANTEDEDLDATSALQAIDTAIETMDNAEVPEAGRVLFVNPSLYRYLKQSDIIDRQYNVQDADGTVSRSVISLEGMPVVKVAKSRFNTEINLLDIDGTDDGGYETDGEDINFMIVQEDAVLPIVKLDGLRVFSPEENQDARGWKFDYRIYHDIFVPTNKTEGVYVSHVTTV